MLTDKEAKKKYISEFHAHPEKYYATEYLKTEGFSRNICSGCKRPFWSTEQRNVCGDPACGAVPFSFIGNSPAKPLDYTEVWKKFSLMFKKFGYTPVKRYPVIARWNPTMEYTNASIAAFQPYVISGEVEPPAKKLIIPQLCFRTVDIDNVGITGSHNTVFSMIGQHMFVPAPDWNQNLVFEHIHVWLKKGLGLPNSEIIFHEDAWAGGGNLGPCMEFFSRGCELGNQVYMMYEQTENGIKGLDLKVLDMGLGQERNTWFSQGVNTIYDATFPTVMKYLLRATGLKFDKNLIGKYVPYSGLLNLDEVENIDIAWKTVSQKTGYDTDMLKKNILPLAGIYSIAEHSRALLVMFSDGALPSNVGDSYNLRIILRRMLSFADKYEFNEIEKLFDMHAKYLKPQYPELSQNLDNVKKIFGIEKEKYESTKEKSRHIISKIMTKDVSTQSLIELYDSQGIPPELIVEEAKKFGKTVNIPENFYALITERHEKREQKHATKKNIDVDFGPLPQTRALYFDSYKRKENMAKVLKIINSYVVLDQTVAYPTSGGQLHDTGEINGRTFVNVFKQGNLIVHQMKDPPNFKEGDEVNVSIDIIRRIQLAKHHTATHIINEAARRVLGSHVNQSSAFKDIDKAHIDITHYASITNSEIEEIERVANFIVKKSFAIEKNFLKRSEAEKKYGVGIYQGGVVPGKDLRIVNISGIDVEACGGTHLDSTDEVGKIIILSAERIQDNISRITFAAGEAAEKYEAQQKIILKEIENILGVSVEKVITSAKDLFVSWKSMRKQLENYRNKKAEMLVFELDKKFVNDMLIEKIENADLEYLQSLSKILSNNDRVVILFGIGGKTYVFASAGSNTKFNAGEVVKNICLHLSGKGGGSKNLGQGVCTSRDVDEVIKNLRKELA